MAFNKSLKAIETKYNGYRFRSRLEARWAVFFDQMGIEYEYEPQGYEMASGLKYLPDFFLPMLNIYVEVKPVPEITLMELAKISEFATSQFATSQKDGGLLLIIGTPTKEVMYLVDRRTAIPLSEFNPEDYSSEGEIVAEFIDGLVDWGNVCFGVRPRTYEWDLIYKTPTPIHSQNYKSSLLAAKQSRFEHGENGAPKKVRSA